MVSSPAVNDAYTVNSPGGSLNIPAPGVLANDTGSGITAVLTTAPSNHVGAFTLASDGSFTYTHNGIGITDSFTYRLMSGGSTLGTATVTITINQPPVANNACVSSPAGYMAGTPITGNLTGNDPEAGSLTFAIVSSPDSQLKGSASTDVAGNFSYTPYDTSKLGMDKFLYTVTDNKGLQANGSAWVFIGGPDNSPPPALRIMPLGDSITAGIYDDSLPVSADRIGYRYELYNDLTALSAGKYGIDFVGSLSDGANYPFDLNHEGHPGWCAGPNGSNPRNCTPQSIADNVIGWLNVNPADILLVHVGTNLFTTDPADVQYLLDRIDTWEASNYPVTVLLARILDDVPNFDTEKDTTTFNNNVAAMVANRINDRVIMVNIQTEAGILYGDGAPGADMANNVHPNQSGYGKMANKWFADLTNAANIGPKFIGLPQCP